MTRTPRLFATIALVGAGSALIYLGALLRFPLLAIYNIPLQNLDRLTGSQPGTGLVIFSCVLLLFAGYALGALALRNARRLAWPVLLLLVALPLVFVALLLFVYPTTSLDVYDYLFRGRMAVRYGANNFLRVPADYGSDPLMASKPFRFIPWSRAVTAYGPLWELMSYATAWLSGERPGPMPLAIDPSLRWLIIGYKALGALGFFACGVAIWGALGVIAPGRRWLGLYLWLWNPLVLWESVSAAHNDAWMVLTVVLAVWAFQWGWRGSDKRRGGEGERQAAFISSLGAFLALTVGGLIKYLALIFGPLMLAASLRRLPTWRARMLLVGLGALSCGLLVVLAYAPFWEGFGTLRNFGDRGVLFYATWLSAVQAGLAELGWMSKELAQRVVSSAATALLALGVLWSAWRGWRAPERVVAHALNLLLWFLLVANPWFQPWYLIWALALASLQTERRRVVAAVVLLCATAMLSYVAGSFLLPVLGWQSESAAWNVLLSLLIYLPPLAMFVVGRRLLFLSAKSAEVTFS